MRVSAGRGIADGGNNGLYVEVIPTTLDILSDIVADGIAKLAPICC